jgi:hypothetical protein
MNSMNDDELKNMSGCPHPGCDKIFSNHLTWNLTNIKTHLVACRFNPEKQLTILTQLNTPKAKDKKSNNNFNSPQISNYFSK